MIDGWMKLYQSMKEKMQRSRDIHFIISYLSAHCIAVRARNDFSHGTVHPRTDGAADYSLDISSSTMNEILQAFTADGWQKYSSQIRGFSSAVCEEGFIGASKRERGERGRSAIHHMLSTSVIPSLPITASRDLWSLPICKSVSPPPPPNSMSHPPHIRPGLFLPTNISGSGFREWESSQSLC